MPRRGPFGVLVADSIGLGVFLEVGIDDFSLDFLGLQLSQLLDYYKIIFP